MPPLSNLFRSGNGQNHGGAFAGPAMVCRPVARGEVDQALRILLGSAGNLAGDEQVLDFLSFAVERNIDVNAIWVAACDAHLHWMLLPVVSPGRTMLLFSPGSIPGGCTPGAISALADAVGEHFLARGVLLSQILIDPGDSDVIAHYVAAGFQRLAELVYLQRAAPRRAPLPDAPGGVEILNYSEQTHALFADAIRQSYASSFDCPAMNGLRDIEDVIVGHKSGTEFDSRMWYVAVQNDRAVGALLLGNSHNDSVELVYLGLAPGARGKGLGDWFMQLAMARVASERRGRLSLAVDSNNQPALRLYHRHGMKQIGTRVALLRDLRTSILQPQTSNL